jgi:predicted transcriptional regulator of viral defense system
MAKLVNRTDFSAKIKAKNISLFSARDVQTLFGVSKVAATFLLYRYNKQGFIVRLKRGLYAFPDALPPELYLANKLYSPSYISREFALSYHGVIPETVYEITSVSPQSTRRFESLGKIYSYRKIKKNAFTGYIVERQKGFTFHIADAEKAFVDTLYYRVMFGMEPISRFNKEKINLEKALKYAQLFDKPKLIAILKRTLL